MTELISILLAPLVANGSTITSIFGLPGYRPWLPFYNYDGFIIGFTMITGIALYLGLTSGLTVRTFRAIMSAYAGSYLALGLTVYVWWEMDVMAPQIFWYWLSFWVVSSIFINFMIAFIQGDLGEGGNSAGSSTVAMDLANEITQPQEASLRDLSLDQKGCCPVCGAWTRPQCIYCYLMVLKTIIRTWWRLRGS